MRNRKAKFSRQSPPRTSGLLRVELLANCERQLIDSAVGPGLLPIKSVQARVALWPTIIVGLLAGRVGTDVEILADEKLTPEHCTKLLSSLFHTSRGYLARADSYWDHHGESTNKPGSDSRG